MKNLPPKLIAHRGASAIAPENTLIAIRKAKELGAQWIEFDVMLTADGEAIVFHDLTLERTTNGRGNVVATSFAEIIKLDAGSWFAPEFAGEKIPSFKEVLLLAKELNLGINVEIKPTPGHAIQTAEVVFKHLEEYWFNTNLPLLVSSGTLQSIATVREYDLEVALGYIMPHWVPNWQDVLIQLNCSSVVIDHKILTSADVVIAKKLGKQILAYTVNNPTRAQELFTWGVDGIFADHPGMNYSL